MFRFPQNFFHQDYLYAILLTVVLAFIVGFRAQRRGRSFFGFFVLSLLLSPLLAYIILVIVGVRFRGTFSAPERISTEESITPWQQQQLRRLGVRDPRDLGGLGRQQAVTVISQVQRQSEYSKVVPTLVLLGLGVAAIYIVHAYFQDPTRMLFNDHTPAPTAGAPAAPPFHLPWPNLFQDPAPTPTLTPALTSPTSLMLPPPPGPRRRSGTVLTTKPLLLEVRYGYVALPAGSAVLPVLTGNGNMVIQYGTDFVTIPINATDSQQ